MSRLKSSALFLHHVVPDSLGRSLLEPGRLRAGRPERLVVMPAAPVLPRHAKEMSVGVTAANHGPQSDCQYDGRRRQEVCKTTTIQCAAGAQAAVRVIACGSVCSPAHLTCASTKGPGDRTNPRAACRLASCCVMRLAGRVTSSKALVRETDDGQLRSMDDALALPPRRCSRRPTQSSRPVPDPPGSPEGDA